ncbi:hypothetical protein DAETH_48830 (plasmid) [Deinococcus aetherius]|uniref:Uncharacterized protein n=1 Tax=Deinococcus aetherius TaxID=200252 RepID=A0ABN6RPV6_9DEIO|nr:hypothetical protein [Deinococcus aetherius]BDP44914.1 hypothetical protein DAETH_48830 [Deinococcus aetherius]
MNDQREWETLLHPGRTLGPLAPSLVPSTWALLLREQVERARLQAYAILADGGTVYLLGLHPGDLPQGLTFQGGKVGLEGVDERGQRVQLAGLPPQLVDLYLYVCAPR